MVLQAVATCLEGPESPWSSILPPSAKFMEGNPREALGTDLNLVGRLAALGRDTSAFLQFTPMWTH